MGVMVEGGCASVGVSVRSMPLYRSFVGGIL
jgi:hypothetical protein